jgi:hypothetical protein
MTVPDIAGSLPLIGVADLIQLGSLWGRAHAAQCVLFVWRGGDAAHRSGGADAFRATPFLRRWHAKVLRCHARIITVRGTTGNVIIVKK